MSIQIPKTDWEIEEEQWLLSMQYIMDVEIPNRIYDPDEGVEFPERDGLGAWIEQAEHELDNHIYDPDEGLDPDPYDQEHIARLADEATMFEMDRDAGDLYCGEEDSNPPEDGTYCHHHQTMHFDGDCMWRDELGRYLGPGETGYLAEYGFVLDEYTYGD